MSDERVIARLKIELDTALRERDNLAAELKARDADAERWRWARRNLAPAYVIEQWKWPNLLPIPEDEETDEHLDRMIDAALRAPLEQEKPK